MSPSPAVSVSSSGALLVGLACAVWLSASCVHCASGYSRRTADPWGWQALVIFCTALSTAHTGVWCYAVYEQLVERAGDEAGLGATSWVLTTHLAILLTLSTLAQAFFTAKLSTLYTARRRAALLTALALLIAAQLGFGIAAAYYSHRAAVQLFMADLGSPYGWASLGSGLAAALANTLIALALVGDMRSSGRFAARDETAVEVFVRLVFESNLATAIVSILALAFYVAWSAQGHESGVSLALSIVLPKLYLLSVLASLEPLAGGADLVHPALSRTMKHASSLSDMFKGTPLGPMRGSRATALAAQAQGTPIADLYAAGAAGGGGGGREEVGWLRRTLQPTPSHADSAATPLHALAPPPAGFAPPPHALAVQDALTAAPVPPPLGPRPLTGISVSDYGAWLDDDEREQRSAYAGSAWASGVEHAAQASGTPTPRRSTFFNGGGAGEEGLVRGGAAAAAAGGGEGAAVAPVRYGYL